MMKSNKITSRFLFNFFFIVIFSAIFFNTSEARLSFKEHVVWPPNREGGTFYLSLEKNKNTNRYPRKGYITALTPVIIKMDNGKYKHEEFSEKENGPKFEYLEFISTSGAYGYIKRNSVKPLNLMARKGNTNLVDRDYNKVVVPIHPLKAVIIYRFSSNNAATQFHSFSRSSLDFVVSNGLVKYKKTANFEKHPYLPVKFFQKIKDGSYIERSGWMRNDDNMILFSLMDIAINPEHKMTKKLNESFIDKVKAIWGYWVNTYDDNKLIRAMNKGCNVSVNFKCTLKGSVTSPPVNLIEISGEMSGELEYQFPVGYRYTADVFIDHKFDKDVRLLKTIKCKQGSSSDWYAERLVFAGVLGKNVEIEMFQDDLLSKLIAYFETPLASGRLKTREKMIRIKEGLDENKKDYFSSFYLLNRYINKEVLADEKFSHYEKQRLVNFIMEQIVEYK